MNNSTDQKNLESFKTEFRNHFDVWVINPAKDLIEHPNGAMPAFVWLTCAIDWLAGFWWGEETKSKVKQAYVDFISEYFPKNKYEPEKLYNSLRNGLVHMYTIKNGDYVLERGRTDLHLTNHPNGKQILNLEDFFDDFVKAKDLYFDDVGNNPVLFAKAWTRLKRDGFLNHI